MRRHAVDQWTSHIMLLKTDYWHYVPLFLWIELASSQGLACYKCMTTNPKSDLCQDPFSSLVNALHNNCQATSKDKNGTFPARFCAKISGRVISIEGDGNTSFINTLIFYRTCVVDNIMESTKLLETSGQFRLKGLPDITGLVRLQGSMSLCTLDGCNHARPLYISLFTLIIGLSVSISLRRCNE